MDQISLSLCYDSLNFFNIQTYLSNLDILRYSWNFFAIKHYQNNKIWNHKSGFVIMSIFLILCHQYMYKLTCIHGYSLHDFPYSQSFEDWLLREKLIRIWAPSQDGFSNLLWLMGLYLFIDCVPLGWFCSSYLFIKFECLCIVQFFRAL